MVDPLKYIISLVLGSSLGIIWLSFFLLEDEDRPEPKSMIFITFILGMLSAWVAAGIEAGFMSRAIAWGFGNQSHITLLVNAFIEELVKFGFVYLLIRRSKYFDEPIDFMIYMITVALGFATMESLLFLVPLKLVGDIISISLLRFIGAALMHAVSSGIFGYFWCMRKIRWGLTISAISHTIFNSLILNSGPLILPTSLLLILSFVLFDYFDKLKETI